jgi:hypothetical protein
MQDRTELHNLLDSRIDAIPDGIPRPDDPIATSWGIGAATWVEGGNMAVYSIFSGKSCRSRWILDVSGISAVGDGGVVRFNLSDFHCLFPPPVAPGHGEWVFERPINVTATARGSEPTYLTTEARLGSASDPNEFDVFISIFAWRPNGRPREGVGLDWRCRALIRLVPEFSP